MRRIILSLSFLCSLSICAQDVKVPTIFNLVKAEDYKPYEDSVRMTALWMINTPLYNNPSTRASANRFLFKWVAGAPTTHIEIRPEFTKDVLNDQTNVFANDLFMNYIAGMVLVKLEANDAADRIAQEAGVRAMLEGYKSIRETSRNGFLEKLLKLDSKKKLTKWIEDNTKVYGPQDKAKILPSDIK